MRALVCEGDNARQKWIESIFQRLNIETTDLFKRGEVYDFVWIHFREDYQLDLIEKLKSEQPNCRTLGYSSDISQKVVMNPVENLMRKFFDELVYWDETEEEIEAKILRRVN